MPAVRLRRDGVVWSDLDGEVVLLDLRTSTYFSARASAAVLVNALADGESEPGLVARLVERYDTTPAAARVDVAAFLGALADRDLLEPAGA
ncbi:MAG: PqqD family protein [Pseudonocardia sp.]